MTRARLIRPRFVNGVAINRQQLSRYCRSTIGGSRHRAKRTGVAHDIDVDFLIDLFIAQNSKCAVSGIVMEVSSDRFGGPFGPSLDRIVPALGYTRGNLRLVCQIVNVAMNAWGLPALEKLVREMLRHRLGRPPKEQMRTAI